MKLAGVFFALILLATIGCSKENPDQIQLRFRQGTVVLDNTTVSNAIISNSSISEGRYSVKVRLKPEAAEKLKSYSKQSLGKTFDVVDHGKVIQSPTVMSTVSSEFLIDDLTKEQADSIAKDFMCGTAKSLD